MTSFPLPGPLNLRQNQTNLDTTWKLWHRQWKNYNIATGLQEKSEEVKVATLLTCIGPEAMLILDGLCTNEEEQKTVDSIVEKFQAYCVVRPNETYERYKFNIRKQEKGEKVDEYVANLRQMTKSCNFGSLEDSLIRDRVVLGIQDDNVRRRLLQESDLTLTQAVQTIRAHETTHDQMQVMAQQESQQLMQHGADLHAVSGGRNDGCRKTAPFTGWCKYCGTKHKFKKEQCPAWGKTCQLCGRLNHVASKCRRARVEMLDMEDPNMAEDAAHDPDSSPPEGHLSTFGVEAQTANHGQLASGSKEAEHVLQMNIAAVSKSQGSKIHAHLMIGGNHIERFQLDTGAGVNVIPQHVYKKACNDPHLKKLKPCKMSLVMYNGSTSAVKGKCRLAVTNLKTMKEYQVEFLVVPQDYTSLLGVSAVQDLDLINVNYANIMNMQESDTTSDKRTTHNEALVREYQDVFTGTGRFQEKLKLEVNPGAKPHQAATRSVPVALENTLKQELDRLTSEGIIAPVVVPTDWVSALVVVKKSDGSLRICLDPKPLNKQLKRSKYPIPTVDDLTCRLAKAKVFTVCDAKNGYWHVDLEEESSFLTTFGTPWGRYRWKRLPFGIAVASEEFQRRLNQELEGLDGVKAIADDILVYGEGETHEEAIADHDRRLRALFERCREREIKLNVKKMKLKEKQVAYMGHLFTDQGLQVDPEKTRAIRNMPTPKDRKGVQRLLGMVNYLQKFSPNLSTVAAPLRQLLRDDTPFFFEDALHGEVLRKIKTLILRRPSSNTSTPKKRPFSRSTHLKKAWARA